MAVASKGLASLGDMEDGKLSEDVKYTDWCLNSLDETTRKMLVHNSGYSERWLLNKKLFFVIGDITARGEEAIVCSTSDDLCHKPVGVAKLVRQAAGSEMDSELWRMGKCCVGASFLTPGYRLLAKYVIFLAGPSPYDQCDRSSLLRTGITRVLDIARYEDIKTVAFPCIGTGGWGLTIQEAAAVTMETTRKWLEKKENAESVDQIVFCFFNEEQRQEYMSEMYRFFPPTTDASVQNSDNMKEITPERLRYPPDLASSPIFGVQIKNTHRDNLPLVFNNVCDESKRFLETQAIGSGTLHEEPYRNCRIFKLHIQAKDNTSSIQVIQCEIIIHMEQELGTIKFKVIQIDEPYWQYNDLCQNLKGYITKHLQAAGVKKEFFFKCDQSSLEGLAGVIRYSDLKHQSNNQSWHICRHGNRPKDCHKVSLKEIKGYWCKGKKGFTGSPSDAELWKIADLLGKNHEMVGLRLGLQQAHIDQIIMDNPRNSKKQAFDILKKSLTVQDYQLDQIVEVLQELHIDTYPLSKCKDINGKCDV